MPTTGAASVDYVSLVSSSGQSGENIISKIMISRPFPVKVHSNLLSNIVQKRTKANKYHTNKLTKRLAFFYTLKSLTTSGLIREYAKHLPELTTILNCANSTFYGYLKACKKMGLIAVNNGTLVLAGYSAVAEYFESFTGDFVTITYDPNKDKLHHLMQAAYIATLQKKQEVQFEAKVNRSPELMQLYETEISILTDDKRNLAQALHTKQKHAFIEGHKHYFELMAYNPDFNLSARLLRKEFNFKSNKSVAYLKKTLAAKGLITVEKREYTSKVRSRLKHAFIKYNPEKNQTTWKLPDAITVAASRLLF